MFFVQKNPSKDFVVLNLTDPQLDKTYLEPNNPDCKFLLQTIEQTIEKSAPDLITISGDLGYGDDPTYPNTCKLLGQFIEQYQIPWSVVWGNHDNQGGTDIIEKTVDLFRQFPHFLYESGDKNLGNGNYVIAVEENGAIVSSIILMDSHNRLPYTTPSGEVVNTWAKLTSNQLEWYRNQIADLKRKNCPSSILITHIPIFAYRLAFSEAFCKDYCPKDISPEQSYDSKYWNEGYKDSFGVRYEDECSYPEDDTVFDLIKKSNHTKAVLCGHDHVNCWSINYKGVRLAYSLKTGCGCYCHKQLNGGTLIKIQSNGNINIEHLFVSP